MAEDKSIKKYNFLNALVAGVICGLVAYAINWLIAQEKVNHDFEALFAPVAVGVVLCIVNFKVLSKLSLLLLPPVFAILGIAPVIGVFLLTKFGFDSSSTNSTIAMVVQNLPFLLVASFLFRWYSGLAGRQASFSYLLFAIVTVVTGMLLYNPSVSFEDAMAGYLGLTGFLLSRVHEGAVLG